MKYLIFFFSCVACVAQAQQADIKKNCMLAMPGVTNKSPGQGFLTEYRFQPGFTMNNLNGQSQKVGYSSSWNLKLKLPLILKPQLTVLAGINYQKESYSFDHNTFDHTDQLFSRLNHVSLKTTRFSLYATKPLNEKFYVGLKTEVMYSGDYTSLSDDLGRFTSYRAAGILGYQPTENTEYGLGLVYSNSFRRTIILPVAFMNHTFNDNWGVELTLPVKLKARYNLSPKSLLLIGSDFESRTYSVNGSNEGEYIYHFQRSTLSLNTTYQYNVKGWLWFQAKAGYNMNFQNRVDDVQMISTSNLGQSNSAFFSIGVFLSPKRK